MFWKENLKKQVTKQIQKITILILIAAALLTLNVNSLSPERTVIIKDENGRLYFKTNFREFADILTEHGIILSPDDTVTVDGDTSYLVEMTINRARTVKVNEEVLPSKILDADASVEDALAQNGIVVTQYDKIEPPLIAKFRQDTPITIQHMIPIVVINGGVKTEAVVPEGTVGTALTHLDIHLNEHDTCTPNFDEAITNGLEITIDRVTFEEETNEKVLPFSVVRRESNELLLGKTKVAQPGANGTFNVTVEKKFLNGELTETKEKSRQTIKPALEQIILIGTKKPTPKPQPSPPPPPKPAIPQALDKAAVTTAAPNTFTDKNGKEVTYTKKLTGDATAYYSDDPNPRTATGTIPARGQIAVNPSVIPYGTVVYLKVHGASKFDGYYTATDTGGALMDGRVLVDIYCNTEGECYEVGRRGVEVLFLK